VAAQAASAVAGVHAVRGDGSARSNPIADEALAEVCVRLPERRTSEGQKCTRAARGSGVRGARAAAEVPRGAADAIGALLRPVHRRLGQLLPFYAAIGARDVAAPKIGTRTIAAFFRELAARRS
jgi:hypothetical protein